MIAFDEPALYAWDGRKSPMRVFTASRSFRTPPIPARARWSGGHMIAINTMWTPNRTVVELRYGFNRFLDDNRPAAFDPAARVRAGNFCTPYRN